MRTEVRDRLNMMRASMMTVALLTAFAVTASAAPITYNVSVDTSAFAGNTGTLQLDFVGAVAALATVTSFDATDGTLGSASTTGAVSGVPPSTVTFGGGNGELLQQLSFGHTLSFNVTFSGGVPSVLLVSFFPDPIGTTPGTLSLDADATGALANWFVIPGPNGEPAPPTTIEEATAVPEPATLLLLSSGLLGLIVRRRK